MQKTILKNAHIVTPHEDFMGGLVIENGVITDIRRGRHLLEGEDLNGKWLIPGCIDIHSDYWEKEIHPRPSANFPLNMAFHFMDQRAAACGITTVFTAISFSEDADKNRTFSEAIHYAKTLENCSQSALVRHFVHARLDPNTDKVLEVLPEIKSIEALKLVVFNENIPGQRQFSFEFEVERNAHRLGISRPEARSFLQEKIDRMREINHRSAISQMLHKQVCLGSHDDTMVTHVDEAAAHGCVLSEMPTSIAAARRAKEQGLWVCMGAPNLVRGGSHCGNLSSLDAMKERLVDMFCSDYHFPTLMTGVMKMLQLGWTPSEAVNQVSLNPAKMLQMNEIGSIEIGKKADLVAFHPEGTFAKVETVWIEGIEKFSLRLGEK
ncbi:alpha-D-ribose 1-methylphosphonate 5-triphosphate diphosphatase [Cyclobacterium xiamenense]|uniref:Alpha-D-ribose 1-methylphosphonate 5-triphosphate diphosphatase n=1 Tax=Cyclobacterium xiamenense TaxID=1297121 RepID=A0A1H6TGZ0_9BACT|nr:alpha-D-ribose 1-methylphosphonate 5-triphosphate diphosphatase [Cyclobacterium xiamenense]SEI79339.1 alpha-D-ribose 1-methylphosphonate 5-triphosphate diphosphatase [Cyclobacterium xiamenense]